MASDFNRLPQSRPPKGPRRFDPLVILAIGCTIPGCAQALLDLSGPQYVGSIAHWLAYLGPWIKLCSILGIAYLCWCILKWRMRGLWRPVGVLLVRPWMDNNQNRARSNSPNYSAAITRHLKLLRISAQEIALAAHIPMFVARFIISHPEVLPSPDILTDLAEVLYLPLDYFRKEQSYGAEYVRKRLKRYHGWGIVSHGIASLNAMSNLRRACILACVEKAILKDLDEKGGEN